MGSVTEERHKQAAQACWALQRLDIATEAHDWTLEKRERVSQQFTEKIEELCAQEIIGAILRDWERAGLCGVYIVSLQNPPIPSCGPYGRTRRSYTKASAKP